MSKSMFATRTVRAILAMALALGAVSSCARPPKEPPRQVKPVEQPRVDVKAQQTYYDRGLQNYAQENYRAAQEDFQKVVENGPTTPLGLKAQENLKKLQQILKTIENIQAK